MPETNLLMAFFLATIVFAWVPGPAMLYTTARTISQGKRAGCMAALGVHIGGYVHVVSAALGLAILFQTVPTLYFTIKLVGAVYLCYLGIKLFRRPEPISASAEILVSKTEFTAFWQSITVEILNPKPVIFFVAFLPQFADSTATLPIWTQLMVLGVMANLMFSVPDIVCVLLSSRITQLFKRSEASTRLVQKIGGTLLIGLGVKLGAS